MNSFKKLTCNVLLLLGCMLLAVSSYCQPFEIRTVNKGMGVIGVEMRSTGGTAPATTDFITDMVFAIKWSATYNVNLAATYTSAYKIQKSGGRLLKSGFHYQTFYADLVPFALPANWVVNSWTEILSISNDMTGTGTGTFAIAETGFDLTTDANIGINLADYTPVINGGTDNVLLPVRLDQFEATPDNRSIRIQWSTVNEQNSKGFEVQRAETGTNQFRTVGWVDSKVKTSRNNKYLFIDRDITAKVKYLYRLKQVDNDDHFTYSPLKTAMLDGAIMQAVQLLPNPVDRLLQVQINTLDGDLLLQITDAKGSVVQTRKVRIEAGRKVELNTSALQSGQYYLTIRQQDGAVITRNFQKR